MRQRSAALIVVIDGEEPLVRRRVAVGISIGVAVAVPGVTTGRGARGLVAEAVLLVLDRLGLGDVARLRACAPRDVRVLAIRAPATASDRAVVEADEIAQLVELHLAELACIADAQVVEREVRERDALQLVDRVAERLDHAVDLAVLALVDRDREPGVLALARQDLDLGGHRLRAVVERDAFSELLDLIVRELTVDLDVIGLRDVARRCEQLRRELTVVGEQEDALGIEVESSDRLHRYRDVRQVVHHRRATAVIRHRGDARLRLVQEHVELVVRHDAFAVDGDLRRVRIDLRAEGGDHHAVDGHATRLDQLLGLAASCDARGRQVPLQTYELAHDLLRGRFGRGVT